MARVEHPCRTHAHAGCVARHSFGYVEERPCICPKRCCKKYAGRIKELRAKYAELDAKGQKEFFKKHIDAKMGKGRLRKYQEIKMYVFTLEEGDPKSQVCMQGFSYIYGIMMMRIRMAIEQMEKRYVSYKPPDHRKEAAPQLEQEITEIPISKIEKYGSTINYYKSFITPIKLYEIFLKRHDAKGYSQLRSGIPTEIIIGDTRITFKYFKKFLKSRFGYQFECPSEEICDTCSNIYNIFRDKEDQLNENLENHMEEVKKYEIQIRNKTKLTSRNYSIETIFIDFDQDLPAPVIQSRDEVFYNEPLREHVLGIYSATMDKSSMYMWPEHLAHKGTDELLTCLHWHLLKRLSPEVEILNIFTYSCSPLLKNSTVLKYLYSVVKADILKRIYLYFPMTGHPYPFSQRIFAISGRIQFQRRRIETPMEWEEVIQGVEGYDVIRLMRAISVKKFSEFYQNLYSPLTQDLKDFRVFKATVEKEGQLIASPLLADDNFQTFTLEEEVEEYEVLFPYEPKYQEERKIDMNKALYLYEMREKYAYHRPALKVLRRLQEDPAEEMSDSVVGGQ